MLRDLALTLCLTMASAATAQEASSTTVSPVDIAKPQPDVPRWLRMPSPSTVAKSYPKKALRRGQAGRVVLDCVTDAEGRMKDCQIVSETPAGAGFGQAALTLSGAFQLTKTTTSGKSTEGLHMRLPIGFTPPGGD